MHMFQEVRSATRAPQSATLVFVWNHINTQNDQKDWRLADRAEELQREGSYHSCMLSYVARKGTITTSKNKNNNETNKHANFDRKYRRWSRF